MKLFFIKIQSFIKLNKQSFIRYFVIGSSGCILDLISLFFLKEYILSRSYYAIMINQLFILLYIFLLNKYWTFGNYGFAGRQMIRFFIVAGFNYVVAVIWMWWFNEIIGLNYPLVRLANIALSVAWNYLLYRFFVYQNFFIGKKAVDIYLK